MSVAKSVASSVARSVAASVGVSGVGGLSPLVNGAIVYDDGLYNKWPTWEYFNGQIYVMASKGGSHADASGPIMIHRSTNGGSSFTSAQWTIGGTPITGVVVAVKRTASGRLVALYQDDDQYKVIKSAYNDSNGEGTWTTGNTITFPLDRVTSVLNYGFVQLSSGKLMIPIYSVKTGSHRIQLVESTNNGATWSIGATVCDYDGSGYGAEIVNEASMVIIPDGTETSDSTTKLLMFARNETNIHFIYFKSADGGATWSTSFVAENPGGFEKHLLYALSAIKGGPIPPALITFNGYVYVIIGCRKNNPPENFNLAYTRAPLLSAYNNNYFEWETPTQGFTANALLLGSPEDWGYFDPKVIQGAIWGVYYDVSTEPLNPAITTDRCWLRMVKIAE